MSTIRIIKETLLPADLKTATQTVHRVGGGAITPRFLQIARYADDVGYYLFYCDEQGKVLTDTLHDTIEDALAQAEFEFGLSPSNWIDVRAEIQTGELEPISELLRRAGCIQDEEPWQVNLVSSGLDTLRLARLLYVELKPGLAVVFRLLQSVPTIVRTCASEGDAARLAEQINRVGGRADYQHRLVHGSKDDKQQKEPD